MKLTHVLLSLLLALYARGERYYFSNLSLESGLSQITVDAIIQDSKGFMWFGTRNGLNRFDGYRFDIFQTKEHDETSISDNHTLCMVEDNMESLWIGTNNGLNKLDLSTTKFKRYLNEPDDPASIPHNTILSVYYDKENRNLWVGTSAGICLYDPEKDNFTKLPNEYLNTHIDAITKKGDNLYIGARHNGVVVYNTNNETYHIYKHNENDCGTIADDYTKALLVDSQGNLWVGTRNNGVSILRKDSGAFTTYNQKNGLSNNYVRCITESPDGEILISTFNGLNVIHPQSGQIDLYTNYKSGQGNLSHYSVITTYFDNAQTLWVGTYAGGVCYYNKTGEKFRFYNPGSQTSVTSIVGPAIETADNLFIATEGTGLLEMNKKTESFFYHKIVDDNEGSYEKNIIKSLCLDGEQILCGTNLGTIYRFDLKTKKFTLAYRMTSEHSIYYLGKTQNGDLITGGVVDKGLTFISKKDGSAKNTFPVRGKPDISFADVRCVKEIKENIFLIGTRNNGLYYYDYENQIVKEYRSTNTNHYQRIPNDYVTCIFKDNRDNIWIGTLGGGISLFNPEFGEFITYNTKDGLHDNNVCAIQEGNEKQLWISTLTGLSEFDLQTKIFKNYTRSNGIKINEFTLHSSLKLSNGNMVFSGNNGFILFHPGKITFNTYIPPVVLRNLHINNEKILPGTKDGILSEPLETQKRIELKYNESNIIIEYCALNFLFSDKNQYQYILEGFDHEWNHVGSRREAYYTNIPPGEYKFIVKGSNNDNLWNNEGTSIIIKVLPPSWKTWWAYCLYTILLCSIFYLIYRYFNEKKRLQNDIRLKQLEAKTQQEIHDARNRLFTNFSHELRTPLTLIMGPLEDVVEKEKLSPGGNRKVHLIQSNAHRLLRIVNNLMDFQKKESGTMVLKVSQSDFILFVHEMTSHFEELAKSRKIKLQFHPAVNTLPLWFDKNLMEKVFFNLLSNAFKNVPNDGKISVSADAVSLDELQRLIPQKAAHFNKNDIPYLIGKIEDSGAGIASEELDNIFIPFYQIAQNEHSHSGTGLGLSLSKSIIEMHHGIIWAESPENSGAIFKYIIPVGKEWFTPGEIVEENRDYDSIFTHRIDIPKENNTLDEKKKKRYTLLIIEDNPDVRQYIISNLCDSYNILEAANGQEGIDKAILHLPDLIISDLMMPKMDGMEMCTKIRNDIRTSHIPIIMLTAKSMNEDIKEGYKLGADDYITKPFSATVLVARVDNLIQSRAKLKELYGKQFTLETLGVEAVSLDEQFLQKLYALMEKNISNPEFDLDRISQDIGMSRTNLYRKIKSLTNLSPSEFIRNFRLSISAKILKEAKLPISEVYVAVGFNSHAYFSNCFKAFYGVSPTEYARKEQ